MEQMKLVKSDNTILYTPCAWTETTDEHNESNKKIAQDLMNFLKNSGGVGLAANQVGLPIQVIAISHPDFEEVLFNPLIYKVQSEPEVEMIEGCLSFPGLWLSIKRPETVHIEWHSYDGTKHQETFTGVVARILQHEMDHIGGKCFTSLVSSLKLTRAIKKRETTKRKLKKKLLTRKEIIVPKENISIDTEAEIT